MLRARSYASARAAGSLGGAAEPYPAPMRPQPMTERAYILVGAAHAHTADHVRVAEEEGWRCAAVLTTVIPRGEPNGRTAPAPRPR
jgi:hypothetical protein